MLLVQTLAHELGADFQLVADIFIPAVLKLTSRANKVYVNYATETLKVCIREAGLGDMLPLFAQALDNNPSKTMRIAAIDCIYVILHINSPDVIDSHVDLLETVMATGILDPTPEVRDLTRTMFEEYQLKYSHRISRYMRIT